MSNQEMSFDALVAIARSEYQEMPGLRLTRAQAQRLWGLPCPRCAEAVLEALCACRFVHETSSGMFARIRESRL